MPRSASRVRFPALCALALLVAGCARGELRSAAGPHVGAPVTVEAVSADAEDVLPGDFSVDLIIRRGAQATLATAAHLRPSHYVLFPDGSLHYADRPADVQALPGRTRRLDRRQLAGVWSLAESLGLTDRQAARDPVNLALLEPPPDGVLYTLALTAEGDRWVFVSSAPGDAAPDAAAVELTRHLAALAWASDEPDRRPAVIPRRYDLGPDPHARYRR